LARTRGYVLLDEYAREKTFLEGGRPMGKLRVMMIIGLALTASLQGCSLGNGDGGGWASCGKSAKLQLVDLDMSPDPVTEGGRVKSFRVSLRSDGPTDCETQVQIRETLGTNSIGTNSKSRLRRGVNRINVEPESSYQFSRQEHCFVVVADIEGNWWPVDAVRRFCARQSGKRWTLKS
jgi:hypothetical protein